MRRTALLAVFLMAVGSGTANAQLPIQFSVNGGLAIPAGDEKDAYENGIHVGVGVKLALVPLQLEGSFDRMGASGLNEDLSVLGGGVSLPIPVTPPLLPVGLYFIAGGGIYRTKAEFSATDFGVNGGAGVRAGIPGISLFGEGRYVVVLSEVSRSTYFTASVGVRF